MRENPHCYTLGPITAPDSPPVLVTLTLFHAHASAFQHGALCTDRNDPLWRGLMGRRCWRGGPDFCLNASRGEWQHCCNTPLRHLQLYAAAAPNGLDPNICSGLVPYVCPWPDFSNSDSMFILQKHTSSNLSTPILPFITFIKMIYDFSFFFFVINIFLMVAAEFRSNNYTKLQSNCVVNNNDE